MATAKALTISPELRVKKFVESVKEKPKSLLLEKNCLTCRRYTKCDNKKKRFNFVCDRFKPLRESLAESIRIQAQPKQTAFITPKKKLLLPRSAPTDAETSDAKFRKIIEEALEEFQTTQLPPDILIDDRDLPLAKNIADFLTPKYLNTSLFAKQIQVALHTLAEYCPNRKCTDLGYVFDIPLHDKMDDVRARVTLLEHGKCPKCKGTRSEFYNKGMFKVPVELALLCGQRCVTGDTILNTAKGFIRFDQLAKFHVNVEGFTDYNGPEIVLENGAVVAPDKFYRGKKESIFKLTTFNGFEIKGRSEHPIKTHRGWVELQSIRDTDCIPIYTNQQIWSSTKLSFRLLARQAKALSNKYLKTVRVISKKIKCEYLDNGSME